MHNDEMTQVRISRWTAEAAMLGAGPTGMTTAELIQQAVMQYVRRLPHGETVIHMADYAAQVRSELDLRDAR